MPLETPEQRRAAAEEWAGYEQAKGQTSAKKQGAALIYSSRDRSPEALLRKLEDKDVVPDYPVPGGQLWVTHALFKVVKLNTAANSIDLLREYYGLPKETTETQTLESGIE